MVVKAGPNIFQRFTDKGGTQPPSILSQAHNLTDLCLSLYFVNAEHFSWVLKQQQQQAVAAKTSSVILCVKKQHGFFGDGVLIFEHSSVTTMR